MRKGFAAGFNQFWVGAVFGVALSLVLVLIPIGWIASSLKDFLHLDATVTVTSEMGSNVDKVTALVREISELLRQGSETKESL